MVSCVDTVILPDDKTVDEDMWQTASDVSGVVAAAYNQMRNEALMRNYIVWGDFRSDELVISNSTSLTNSSAYKQDLNQIYSLNITPSNAFANWDALYSVINYCNLVLKKAEGVMALDPNYAEGNYKADCAKVKSLRALCYFYLVRVFRDVPVTDDVYMSSEQERLVEQQAPAQVIEMCINDLKEVVNNSLVSDTYGDWRDKGYMTRDAINALLADIYLWRASINHDVSDYQACVEYCNKVIEAKKAAHVLMRGEEEAEYYLEDYDDFYSSIFGESNQNAEESIFELQFHSVGSSTSNANNVGLQQMYYNYTKIDGKNPPYLMTTTNYGLWNGSGSSANLFKNGTDRRLSEFIYGSGSSSEDTQFRVRKFVCMSDYDMNTEKASARTTFYQNWIIYRLTDIMLMKAEALVQLYQAETASAEEGTEATHELDENGKNMNEQAFDLVQFVNARALPDGLEDALVLKYSTYKDKMEELVLQERARELCFEGKRWFDLMRYNYRHVEGVQYDKTFAQMEGSYVSNYSAMLKLAVSKYSSDAMMSKMPTEPYLYWPIGSAQMDLNTNLVQNPVWKAAQSSVRK